ncbi:MAG: hypothetical protein V1707_01865 [bacterium]
MDKKIFKMDNSSLANGVVFVMILSFCGFSLIGFLLFKNILVTNIIGLPVVGGFLIYRLNRYFPTRRNEYGGS